MKKSDFYVGQPVYTTVYNRRYCGYQEPGKYLVTKIGTKYITVSNGYKYQIKDGIEKDPFDSFHPALVFLDPEDYYRMIEHDVLYRACSRQLSIGREQISFEQLEKIAEILGIEYEKCERK